MNKNLLLVPAVLFAFGAYPQAGKKAKMNGFVDKTRSHPVLENGSNKTAAPTTNAPVKKHPNSSNNKTTSTTGTSCTHFSGSANAFGFYQGGHESLGYNADVNAITFTHRAAPCYSTVPNGNTGTIVQKFSTNNGTTWDSTVVWANTTNLGRYPQGGLYNPIGNTNITNAYAVVMGEYVGAAFDGTYYASKKYTVPGTMTAGTDQQSASNVTPFGFIGKHIDFSRYGFSYTKDGLVRGLGEICNDVNNTTSNVGYGPRGEAIMKGTFSAGAFTWAYDSLVPPVILRSDGSRQISTNQADMAWNDAGTVGYVVMIGARLGTTGSMKGYQPIVYKTTNSGASWSLLPANDWTSPCFQYMVDRLWPVSSGTLIVPFFSVGEGMDLAVDANDNLHMATTVVGAYSTNNDSLEYTGSFGTEKYSFPYGNLGNPTIYDFYTTTGGSWRYHIVDSMQTEGPSGTSGNGGFAVNPWASSAVGLDARIQITHSPDRKRMFYSYGESDTNVVGLHWNIYPNIIMRGYDIQLDKVTPRVNVTGGLTTPDNADQVAYFHYAANRSILTNSVTGINEIPFTLSYNNTNDGNVPVNHYYVKGASFSTSDFTMNKMTNNCSVGFNNVAKVEGFEVNSFPNPSNGITTILIKLAEQTDLNVTIYNMVGHVIKNIDMKGRSGDNNLTLDLTNLSSGVYMYTVKAGNSAITKKLIIE